MVNRGFLRILILRVEKEYVKREKMKQWNNIVE